MAQVKLDKLHFDFETYSEADLKNVGAWAYSKHPSTKVLMMAWAFNTNTPALWLPGDELPFWHSTLGNLYGYIPFQLNAWNDFFELSIMKNVLKWPIPAPRYWADTAAKAAVLALPRNLGDCGEALGLSGDKAKDKEGKKLMGIFSWPRKSAKKATRGQLIRTFPADDPENFEKYKRYCIQDVVAERVIDGILPELQPRTRELWELDRAINLRGLRFDMPAVKDALVIIADAKAEAVKKVADRTQGLLDNIGSRDQFLEFMSYLDTPLENAQKEYLEIKLEELENTPGKDEAAAIVRLRLQVSRSSLAKYDKMLAVVDDKNRAHGLLRFHGAGTGRWSGNNIQPHNFPKKSLDLPDLCIELFKYRDPATIELLFGDVLEAMSYCLRGMITASPGNRLVVSDFSQIESRVLAWLARDVKKLEAYANNLDIYKVNAAKAFKIPYEDVTKTQRDTGKVMELSLGFGGGENALSKMCKQLGVHIPPRERMPIVIKWRLGNSKITSYWKSIEALAIAAVDQPGTIHMLRNVSFKMVGSGTCSFLFCTLPSGRRLAYHRPYLSEGKYGKDQLGYWSVDSTTKKYGRQHTYGGKLVENITQAVAMDVMADRMLAIDPIYPLVLTVHDELVSDTPKGRGSIEDFNKLMVVVPDWAKGLPIAADGYEAERYKK